MREFPSGANWLHFILHSICIAQYTWLRWLHGVTTPRRDSPPATRKEIILPIFSFEGRVSLEDSPHVHTVFSGVNRVQQHSLKPRTFVYSGAGWSSQGPHLFSACPLETCWLTKQIEQIHIHFVELYTCKVGILSMPGEEWQRGEFTHRYLAKAATSALCCLLLYPPSVECIVYGGGDDGTSAPFNWFDLKFLVPVWLCTSSTPVLGRPSGPTRATRPFHSIIFLRPSPPHHCNFIPGF